MPTDRMGVMTTDVFQDVLGTDLVWEKADEAGMGLKLKNRATGAAKFMTSRSDLVFGSNAPLRSVVDAVHGPDGQRRFVADFVRV